MGATLDGEFHNVAVDGNFPYPKLRANKLGVSRSNVNTKEFCVLLHRDRSCPTMQQVDPGVPVDPPYSPPPPRGFPFCSCRDSFENSNYALSDPVASRTSNGMQQYCFKVIHDESQCVNSGHPVDCCNFDLYKVEFEMTPGCYGSVAYTTLDGVWKPPFTQFSPPSLRVTQIKKASNISDNTEICLILRPPCTTLDQLCAGDSCKYAIFNAPWLQTKCCPVGETSEL
eukprot:gene16894-23169_t